MLSDSGVPVEIANAFGYNQRSEVTEATMGTNSYGYAYDPIGNTQCNSSTIIIY